MSRVVPEVYETLGGRYFHACRAIPEDVQIVAENLRPGDRLELERMYDDSPQEVIRRSLADSEMAWTAHGPEGLPVAIWGVSVSPTNMNTGIPWLVGTDRIKENLGDFLWLSKKYDAIMCKYYSHLGNLVDAEYAEARRWLRWLRYKEGLTVKSPKGFNFIVMNKDTQNVRQY